MNFKTFIFTVYTSFGLIGCNSSHSPSFQKNFFTKSDEAGLIQISETSQIQPYKYSRTSKSCLNSSGGLGRNTDGNLECADFTDEDWAKKDLKGASLRGSKLTGVNFFMADLSESDLSAADLSGSSLFKANLSRAIFDADTKLPDDLTKEQFIQRGGIFRTYEKIDQDFSDAILSGQFDVAQKLLEQLATVNDSFYLRAKEILKGPTKQILQYFIQSGIDFSNKDSSGKQTLFKGLFEGIQNGDDIQKLIESKDEIGILIERSVQHGMSLDDLWLTATHVFERQAWDDAGHPELLDPFLQAKELNVNRTWSDYSGCHSLASKLRSLKSISYLITAGFNFSTNPCTENDSLAFLNYIDFEKIKLLESQGWNFKITKDGRSEIFDDLMSTYMYPHLDDTKKKEKLERLLHWGMNGDTFLQLVPKSLDDLMDKVVKSLYDKTDGNPDAAKEIIQLFDLVHRTNSQGKNLILLVPLTFNDSQYGHPYLTDTTAPALEELAGLGVPLVNGKDSLLIETLIAFNRSVNYDDHSTRVNLLSKVIDLYKKTQTPLDKSFNNENLIFLTQYLDAIEILAQNGFSLNERDAQGRSLYWRLPKVNYDQGFTDAFYFLITNHVPFDPQEEIGGKHLLSAIYEQFNRSSSYAPEFIKELVDNKVVDLSDQKTQNSLKQVILGDRGPLGSALLQKMNEMKLVPLIRFAQCDLGGRKVFLEDPNMNFFKTLRMTDSDGSNLEDYTSFIVILDEETQVFDARSSVKKVDKTFGINLSIQTDQESASMTIGSNDLESISLNGKNCVSLAQYPPQLKDKFQFVYLDAHFGTSFFINLKGNKWGDGFLFLNEQARVYERVSLIQPSDLTDQIWPGGLKDHYVWQMYGKDNYSPYSNLGGFALPKTAFLNPTVGRECEIQHFDRRIKKVESRSCLIKGLSY